MVSCPAVATVTIVDGEPIECGFVVRYEAEGKVTGVPGWNMGKQARLRTNEIADIFAPAA